MNRRSLMVFSVLGLTLAASACHKTKPTTAPTPMAAPPSAAPSTGTTTAPVSNPSSAPVANRPADNSGAASSAAATIGDRIHFAYNISDIADTDQVRLNAKASLLKRYPMLRIRITGHADERGSDEYNVALGMRRATAAKDFLVRVGIDASRIDVASLGRQAPIDQSGTDAAFAANRRDEFDIIAGSQSLRGN